MKKKTWGATVLSVALFGALASCGNKTSESGQYTEAQLEDSLQAIEQADSMNQAQKEDSLEAIDEMVNAVETAPTPNGDWKSTYNASFFSNTKNQSEKPSANTYVQTNSGLKYTIITPGSGKNPSATDQVTVHYVGMLPDGTVFDSSIDRGEPTTFPLNRVIPGWTEGLQLMKPNGVAVFYIPSSLGYGETGVPGTIPPGAPLIFWVQLLKVN